MPDDSSKIQFTCRKCGKVCTSKFDEQYCPKCISFLRKDDGWHCDTCGKVFSSKGVLRNHRYVHSKQSSIICRKCGKTTKRPVENLCSSCARRNFICENCGKTYKSLHDVHLCRACRSAASNKVWRCDKCDRIFKTKKGLMQHEGVHGNSFECPICSFLASTKQSLGSHVAMHDDDKRELRITRAECSYLKRYGVTAPSLSPEIRERQKQTMLDRYGVSTPLNLPESREKAIKNAWTSEARKKRSDTNIDRYGAECVFTGDPIQEKIKRIIRIRYGVDNPMQSPLIQEKVKRTCLKHFGVDCSFKSPEVREKARLTCVKNHGVDYGFMKVIVGTGRVKGQKSDVINKSGKKIHCDSSYEDRFCKCLLSDSLIEDFDRGERIRLIGQDHWYYPDFLVNLTDGRKELVEIKGSFTIKDPSVPFKVEAALAWCEENGVRFWLVMEDELDQYERLVETGQSMFEVGH